LLRRRYLFVLSDCSFHFCLPYLVYWHDFADNEVGEANRLFLLAEVVPIDDWAVNAPLGAYEVAGIIALPQIEIASINVEDDCVVIGIDSELPAANECLPLKSRNASSDLSSV
jgi:hypothetical protein